MSETAADTPAEKSISGTVMPGGRPAAGALQADGPDMIFALCGRGIDIRDGHVDEAIRFAGLRAARVATLAH